MTRLRQAQRLPLQGVAVAHLAHLAQMGLPTATLISDLSNSRRVAYVGLDNRAAGRTAAYLIARFMGPLAHSRQARVAMIVGSLHYRAHEECEAGFLHLFEEQFPLVQVVGVREGQDDAERNYHQTRALLEHHGDLAGIYNIGGGAEGIGRALKEAGADRKIVFIGHGLTPDTRALLIGCGHHPEPAGRGDELRADFCECEGWAGADEWGGDEAEPGDFSREFAVGGFRKAVLPIP